jgi:hypothetical protein
MAQQAMDTFMAVLGDGSQRLVTKGEVFPDGHELVKRDQDGSGRLFRKLDLGEDEEAKPKPAARRAARSDG